MNYLFEYADILNTPYEAFLFDTAVVEFPIRPHWHHYVEILYIIEGNVMVSTNDREYYLSEDEMVLFHQGDIHAIYSSNMKTAKYYVIKFNVGSLSVSTSFTPRLSSLLKAARNQNARTVFTAKEGIDNDIRARFESCITELNGKQLGYDVRVHAELSSILIGMLRAWQRDGIDYATLRRDVLEDETSLHNVTEYIDSHLSDNIMIEDLAKMCNMSYSHFARSFKETYGHSCKEYIEILKIEKAEEMLNFTDCSLSEISQEMGFSDCSHFIRIFKRLKGVTPGSIRKKRSGSNLYIQ